MIWKRFTDSGKPGLRILPEKMQAQVNNHLGEKYGRREQLVCASLQNHSKAMDVGCS
jgi:hypothetical protein